MALQGLLKRGASARSCVFAGVFLVSGDILAQAPAPAPGGWQTAPQQMPPQQPYGWSPASPPPYPAANYGAASYSAPSAAASDGELGTLYGASVLYGVWTGIWIDSMLGLDDPGIQFLPPAVLGVAAPVAVYFLNRPRMPRGAPAAISAGMAIGTGEGLIIAGYQSATAKEGDAMSFKGVATAVFVGSTIGTVGGYVTAATMEPSPRTSILAVSGAGWGTIVGSMFGYGSSTASSDWSSANDGTFLGGLIGYNVGAVGSLALSTVWVPTYKSLAWMWVGFGAGLVASLPVYLFYAGSDHDARRGLIFQGTAATLGLVAGAVFTSDSKEFGANDSASPSLAKVEKHSPVEITGGGLLPVRSGFGLQISGTIF